MILGGRPEWAWGLDPSRPCLDGEECPLLTLFVFLCRFEFSIGTIDDLGYVLGTVVVGPSAHGLANLSEPKSNWNPWWERIIVDLGIKAGGIAEVKQVDLLIGPRLSADFGFLLEGNPRHTVQPYVTAGATFGIMPRVDGDGPGFIVSLEPGVVICQEQLFTFAVLVGVVL